MTDTVAAAAERKSAEGRKQLLVQAVQSHVAQGFRVESHTGEFGAVLVKGHRPNHLMHLLLTVVTAGVWLIGWLIRIAMGSERRVMITVDELGNVLVQKL